MVGAVAGAATAKRTVEEKANLIALKVLLRNPQHPCFTIKVLAGVEIPKSSVGYQSRIEKAMYWHKLMDEIIDKQAGRGPAAQPSLEQPTPATGVAQEIRELAALRQEGLLSDEEFQQQKEQLLRGRAAR